MNKKSFYTVFLAGAFFLLSCLTAFGQAALHSSKTIYFKIIPFGSTIEDSAEIPVEWNPEWFNADTFTYSHDIARIACALSDIAYLDISSNSKDNPLTQAYTQMGADPSSIKTFYDIDYSLPFWGNDQCAFSLAHSENIMFITLRGTPFNSNEWISNMNISDSSPQEASLHEGFLKATVLVEEAVMQYVREQSIDTSSIRLLITGHSRGASIANLLAAKFAVDKTFPAEHIFAYTFAAPNVTTSPNANTSQFDFIWNIVNAEDFVPSIIPNRNEWKFTRYGKTKVLVNSWNTDYTKYEEELLAKINTVFRRIKKRDYRRFATGPFFPVQIGMLLTDMNKNLRSYYKGITSIHGKANLFLRKSDIPALAAAAGFGSTEDQDGFFMRKAKEIIRKKTEGVSDYAAQAMQDMHTCETYFSYLMALSEEEAFSTLGCSQIIIEGMATGFVQDSKGAIVVKFEEGRVKYSSVKRPVYARNKGLDGIVIGFPANQDYKIIMSQNSIGPTAIRITEEHLDADGTLLKRCTEEKFYASTSVIYSFDAGSSCLIHDTLHGKAIKGKEKNNLAQETGLFTNQKAKFTLELNMDTEGSIGYGIHYGPSKIYATLLSSTNIFGTRNSADIQPGIGTQIKIAGPLNIDVEALLKCTWIHSSDFVAIPAIRTSLSFMPFRRFRMFASVVSDFKIEGFNECAFSPDVYTNRMSEIYINDTVKIMPSLQFGIRF